MYLDFMSGVAVMNLGYGHPKVIEAIKRQSESLMHYSGYIGLHETYIRLAEKLQEIAPCESLREAKVCFVNSGTEAVEAALKLARAYEKRSIIASFIPAYHGHIGMGALSITTMKASMRKKLTSVLSGAISVPYAYCYRCLLGHTYPDCNLACIKYLERIFETVMPPEDVAALVVEPIMGGAGYVVPPDEFLPSLQRLCRDNSILLVCDEVQSGFGRTGKMFALEHWSIQPDLMTISKGMGGGLPIGGIIARKEIMDLWEPGGFGTTLGGNPMACAAGLATIEALQDERLMENATKVGNHILMRLNQMKQRHELIGDVRGKGLMIGVELVKDRRTKEPAVEETKTTALEAFKRGLIITPSGTYGNVIRILPPLILTLEMADKGIDILDETLNDIERKCARAL